MATLIGCSGSSAPSPPPPSQSISTPTQHSGGQGLSAKAAFERIEAKVPTAKLTVVYTAETDENHLLGRPHQYTSKIAFEDSRISPSDASGWDKGDIQRGGSIEAFENTEDAQRRKTYVETITSAIAPSAEYDYLNGTVLVRVSHYLTPAQASDYKAAVATLDRWRKKPSRASTHQGSPYSTVSAGVRIAFAIRSDASDVARSRGGRDRPGAALIASDGERCFHLALYSCGRPPSVQSAIIPDFPIQNGLRRVSVAVYTEG